jgi:hypothetical protein
MIPNDLPVPVPSTGTIQPLPAGSNTNQTLPPGMNASLRRLEKKPDGPYFRIQYSCKHYKTYRYYESLLGIERFIDLTPEITVLEVARINGKEKGIFNLHTVISAYESNIKTRNFTNEDHARAFLSTNPQDLLLYPYDIARQIINERILNRQARVIEGLETDYDVLNRSDISHYGVQEIDTKVIINKYATLSDAEQEAKKDRNYTVVCFRRPPRQSEPSKKTIESKQTDIDKILEKIRRREELELGESLEDKLRRYDRENEENNSGFRSRNRHR